VTTDGVWIGNRIYRTLAERNYSLPELQTPKLTITTAHVKSSQSSLIVAWSGFQRRTFPFLWVPELSPTSDELLVLVI
jgi:hypothetical protein